MTTLACKSRNEKFKPVHTEKAGGTDASSPVVLSNVVTGMIRSALGAGGCVGDDWKNVAERVAR